MLILFIVAFCLACHPMMGGKLNGKRLSHPVIAHKLQNGTSLTSNYSEPQSVKNAFRPSPLVSRNGLGRKNLNSKESLELPPLLQNFLQSFLCCFTCPFVRSGNANTLIKHWIRSCQQPPHKLEKVVRQIFLSNILDELLCDDKGCDNLRSLLHERFSNISIGSSVNSLAALGITCTQEQLNILELAKQQSAMVLANEHLWRDSVNQLKDYLMVPKNKQTMYSAVIATLRKMKSNM